MRDTSTQSLHAQALPTRWSQGQSGLVGEPGAGRVSASVGHGGVLQSTHEAHLPRVTCQAMLWREQCVQRAPTASVPGILKTLRGSENFRRATTGNITREGQVSSQGHFNLGQSSLSPG